MKARWKIISIVCFALAAVEFCGSFLAAKNGADALPQGSLLVLDSPLSISMETLTAAGAEDCFAAASLSVTAEDGEAIPAAVIAPGALEAFGAALSNGTDFSEAGNEAVLGADLAASLCGTTEAAGKTVTFDGHPYTVCGVLAESEGVFTRRARGAQTELFLSTPPDNASAPLDVTQVYVASDTPLLESEAAAKAQAAFGPLQSEIYSLGDGGTLLRQVPKFALLLFAAVPFVLLCIWGVLEWSRLPTPRRSGMRAAVSGAAFAGALLLLWRLLSAIELPGALLPADVFFDGAHYRALFEAFRASFAGPAGSFFPWRLLAVSGKWSAVWGAAGAAFCWLGSGVAFAALFRPQRLKGHLAEAHTVSPR